MKGDQKGNTLLGKEYSWQRTQKLQNIFAISLRAWSQLAYSFLFHRGQTQVVEHGTCSILEMDFADRQRTAPTNVTWTWNNLFLAVLSKSKIHDKNELLVRFLGINFGMIFYIPIINQKNQRNQSEENIWGSKKTSESVSKLTNQLYL